MSLEVANSARAGTGLKTRHYIFLHGNKKERARFGPLFDTAGDSAIYCRTELAFVQLVAPLL
jgi:hypothetical protein